MKTETIFPYEALHLYQSCSVKQKAKTRMVKGNHSTLRVDPPLINSEILAWLQREGTQLSMNEKSEIQVWCLVREILNECPGIYLVEFRVYPSVTLASILTCMRDSSNARQVRNNPTSQIFIRGLHIKTPQNTILIFTNTLRNRVCTGQRGKLFRGIRFTVSLHVLMERFI